MSRGPDGRYGYQAAESSRDPVAVTCCGCRAKISGTFHKRLKRGPFGRYTADLCGRCVPSSRYETVTGHVCPWCGRSFTTTSLYHRSDYCTAICSRRARRDDRRHARKLWRGPACANCRAEFDAARIDAAYCSPACRQAAYRKRLAEQAAKRASDRAMIESYDAALHEGAR